MEHGWRSIRHATLRRARQNMLGELGALDPARVKITLGGFCPIELKDMSLAKELICSPLARVLRYASDLDMLGSAELAVQELLKMSKASTLHDDLWIMLPTEIQDLVQPCLRSQYKLEESGVPAPASVPVFGDKTLSFRRWAVAWIRHRHGNFLVYKHRPLQGMRCTSLATLLTVSS